MMASTHGIRRRFTRFLRMPVRAKLLVPFAFVLLGFARLAVLTVPFRVLRPWLGQKADLASDVKRATTRQEALAQDVGRAVRGAATLTPWKSVCLPQAMVAVLMLRLMGVPTTAFLGVRSKGTGEDGLDAHAWVATGSVAFITGHHTPGEFTVVGVFQTWTGTQAA